MGVNTAIFLDRDDTIIDTQGATRASARPGDLWMPDLVRLMPGVGPALRGLAEAGFKLVLFTSQGGVARGGYGLREVEAVNDRMRALLRAEGVRLDGVYYCPYHPTGSVAPWNVEHSWRKPAPGMITAAASELGLDVGASWAIGDKPRDVEAAIAGGVPKERAVLIRTSGEAGTMDDVPAVARVILAARARERGAA